MQFPYGLKLPFVKEQMGKPVQFVFVLAFKTAHHELVGLDTVDNDTVFSRRAGEQDHLSNLERWTRDLPLPQSKSVAALEAGPCDSTVDPLNLSGVAYTRPGHPRGRAHFANCCGFPSISYLIFLSPSPIQVQVTPQSSQLMEAVVI